MTAALLTSVLLASGCGITGAAEVRLADAAIRIRDVADLSCLAPAVRDTLGALILADVPRGGSVDLTRDALAVLVRRRVPMLDLLANGGQRVRFLADVTPAAQHICARATRDLQTGRALTEGDVARAPCASQTPNSRISYDRQTGLVRLRAFAAAGEELGPLPRLPRAIVDQGDELSLAVTVGPAHIDRRVIALQDSRAGERVWVEAEDGEIFPVVLAEAAP